MRRAASLIVLLALGCGQSGTPETEVSDGGPSTTSDASVRETPRGVAPPDLDGDPDRPSERPSAPGSDDEAPPLPEGMMTPPTETTPECEAPSHLCGDTCESFANDPDFGCSQGCGDPCAEPEGSTSTCTADGRCDFECNEGLVLFDGACVDRICEQRGAVCGVLEDDAGHTVSCGSCAPGVPCSAEHTCDVPLDALEPNDSRSAASAYRDIYQFWDNLHPDGVEATDLTLHRGDEDWFTFRAIDDWTPGNPIVRLHADAETYEGNPFPEYELTAWYECDSATVSAPAACVDSNPPEGYLSDVIEGSGCVIARDAVVPVLWLAPHCEGTDESGTVHVRVRMTPGVETRGVRYTLWMTNYHP